MNRKQKRRYVACMRLFNKLRREIKRTDGHQELRSIVHVHATSTGYAKGNAMHAPLNSVALYARTYILNGGKVTRESFPSLWPLARRARHLRRMQGGNASGKLALRMQYDDIFNDWE